MKKILLVLLLSGLLFACGGKEENKDAPAEEAVQEQVDSVEEAVEEAAETTEEAAEEVAEKVEKAVEKAKTGGESTKPTNAGLTGKVVKMTDFISGNYETLSVARVKELVMAGQYVGFLSNGTFYMVYNAAGNYDWKGLAKVSGEASVTIEGKVSKVNGVSIIMATNIAS
jgi:ElaB/YqjD/DUF883 family membrane-anchored ribosome-binding protein